ncbi:enoyl-CoA hydratase/isomerase family protein [Arthrobacter sp. W4I7]|uniref:enoyl-CoA hydratase/isomerase family protein n=1 Tax=Arthrobacter sp. W4I7 TaxID=3042296 RepID=UPI002784E5C7|nr:enoyl-CoA hydratase/isomerase family protein [Arthrobacter sp. W4I7]MDQ0691353.1 2-(1,2-epoxy-1,2-dihydrophenyl)acetyl-CoA isomerase [Arthrobacter sp. W4I7]
MKASSISSSVHVRQEGPVAWLTLNRPESANAVDLELATAFRDAILELEAVEVRVVVIEANGQVFCGGGDVEAMRGAESASQYLAELAGTFHQGLELLARSNSIIIAAVDGAAAGAGLGLVLNADIVVATPRARFLTAYAGVGLSPDSGVSYLLPRSVGTQRALQMSLTGRVLDAGTAKEWGIVAELVAPEELEGYVRVLAVRLASGGGNFLGATRRLIRSSTSMSYPQHLDAEVRAITTAAQHPDTLALLREFARHSKEPKAQAGAQ